MFPIGEPRKPGFHYCDGPLVSLGTPYCMEHQIKCIQKKKPETVY